MKVLVTGAAGFIGKNLVVSLERSEDILVVGYDLGMDPGLLDSALATCDFVFHLAGVNRPETNDEFTTGNVDFTRSLCSTLRKRERKPGFLFSSSTQAALDNPYGLSKKLAEDEIRRFADETGTETFVFRLPGVFGKWSRPNFNSVVATFCHNIARGLPIDIRDPQKELELVYIADVVAVFLDAIKRKVIRDEKGRCHVESVFRPKLGEIAGLIRSFHEGRNSLMLPDISDPFTKRLYATYLSYLPGESLRSPLDIKADQRGSLVEVLKSPGSGQVFVSRTRPGVTRGKHYHDTKVEKFIVLDGQAIIRLRDIRGDHIIEIRVSGEQPEIVDIPPGHTHSIENIGSSDLLTLFWADEIFDSISPDTYFAEVNDEKT